MYSNDSCAVSIIFAELHANVKTTYEMETGYLILSKFNNIELVTFLIKDLKFLQLFMLPILKTYAN